MDRPRRSVYFATQSINLENHLIQSAQIFFSSLSAHNFFQVQRMEAKCVVELCVIVYFVLNEFFSIIGNFLVEITG